MKKNSAKRFKVFFEANKSENVLIKLTKLSNTSFP